MISAMLLRTSVGPGDDERVGSIVGGCANGGLARERLHHPPPRPLPPPPPPIRLRHRSPPPPPPPGAPPPPKPGNPPPPPPPPKMRLEEWIAATTASATADTGAGGLEQLVDERRRRGGGIAYWSGRAAPQPGLGEVRVEPVDDLDHATNVGRGVGDDQRVARLVRGKVGVGIDQRREIGLELGRIRLTKQDHLEVISSSVGSIFSGSTPDVNGDARMLCIGERRMILATRPC